VGVFVYFSHSGALMLGSDIGDGDGDGNGSQKAVQMSGRGRVNVWVAVVGKTMLSPSLAEVACPALGGCGGCMSTHNPVIITKFFDKQKAEKDDQ